MTDHASDCALHNAPAVAPGACSCGVSRRFRIFEYDICNDTFAWRTFSRETLVAEVFSRSLSRCYGDGKVVRIGTMIGRAVQCGLTANETNLFTAEWAALWAGAYAEASRRAGNETFLSEEGGTYLNPADFPDLTREPDFTEISEALAPWIEWWATQPEPVMSSLRAVA